MPARPRWGERVTFTIVPRPRGTITLVPTARHMFHVPSAFRRMTVRKPFGVMLSAGAMYWPPALFTSRSILSWRSITPSTIAST